MGIQAPVRGGPLSARESYGQVTARMVALLQRMRLWAMVAAGWCVVAAGMLLFAGTVFLLGKRAVPGLRAEAPVWPTAGMALLAAVAVGALAVPVFRFARSLSWVGGPDGEREIEWSLLLHRGIWRLLGILAPSLLALALIASYLTSPHRTVRAVKGGFDKEKTPRFENLAAACPLDGETAMLCTAVVRYDRQGRPLARGDWVSLRGRSLRLTAQNGGDAGILLEGRVVPASGTWSIFLDAPLGRPLVPGLYTGAMGGGTDRKRPILAVSFSRTSPVVMPRKIAMPMLPLSQEACPGTVSRFRIDRLGRAADSSPQDVQVDFERVCPDPQGFWVTLGRVVVRPGPEGGRR